MRVQVVATIFDLLKRFLSHTVLYERNNIDQAFRSLSVAWSAQKVLVVPDCVFVSSRVWDPIMMNSISTTPAELNAAITTAWKAGRYFRRACVFQDIPANFREMVDAVPYEGFMTAWVLAGELGRIGRLIVEFSSVAAEDNYLHTHPSSGRILDVLSGTGWFIAVRDKIIGCLALSPGDQILMPPDTLHTFLAGEMGMTLASIHAPFQGFEGTDVIKRSGEQINLSALVRGELMLPALSQYSLC